MSQKAEKPGNPLVFAAVAGWRRHFLASSLRATATSTSPSFKLRKRPPADDDAVEEPPSKRTKLSETPEPTANVPPIALNEQNEDSIDDEVEESVEPADVAIPDNDPDGKILIATHFPKDKWVISCSAEGCSCTHCGPARAQICCECEHPIQQHEISLAKGPAKENILIVVNRLFDLVAAIRSSAFVFQFYHWISPLLAKVKAEASTMQHNLAGRNVSPQLKGLIFAFQELMKKVAELPALSACSSSFSLCPYPVPLSYRLLAETPGELQKFRVEVVILADSMYWEMYHFSSVGKLGLEKKFSIPPPDVYFERFSHKHLAAQARNLYTFIHDVVGRRVRRDLERRCDGDLLKAEDFSDKSENILVRLWRIKWRETVELFFPSDFLKQDYGALLEETVKRASRAKRKQAKHAESGEYLARGDEHLEEPVCFDLLQRWRDVCRDWPCVIFAYAIPNKLALDRLRSLNPIVEIGAGTGWWAHTIQQLDPSVSFACYDTIPPCPEKTDNEFHGNRAPFVPVQSGDAFNLLSDPSNEHRTLFLCYPPPKDAMAMECLQHFMGSTVVHVGEWEGFTGTRDFETRICTEYLLVERIELPNWSDTAYFMTIWKRKSKLPEPQRLSYTPVSLCTFCKNPGVPEMPLHRCRFCRGVQYCSKQCVVDDGDHHARVHRSKMIDFDGWLNFFNPLHFAPMKPF